MPNDDKQRRAFDFLLEKFNSQEVFSREEFQAATGWDGSFKTYLSKQFKTLLLKLSDGRYRVSEAFRRFNTWEKFKNGIVTQNRRVASDYSVITHDQVIIFEFFMPLTNEGYLRQALDALFYKDSIISRLRTMNQNTLNAHFPRNEGESTGSYYERICYWISQKLGGYSISHVDGRFRADELKYISEVSTIISNNGRYLVDETTAIVRFIFPCGVGVHHNFSPENYFEDLALGEEEMANDEASKIRLFFFTLFVQSIVLIVNGEDEIWMLESGIRNRLHIWRVQN